MNRTGYGYGCGRRFAMMMGKVGYGCGSCDDQSNKDGFGCNFGHTLKTNLRISNSTNCGWEFERYDAGTGRPSNLFDLCQEEEDDDE